MVDRFVVISKCSSEALKVRCLDFNAESFQG